MSDGRFECVPIEHRIKNHVLQLGPLPTECWIWQGSLRRGYGQIGWDGKNWFAHRVMWTLCHGEIPEGIFVLHHCDTPSCINPDHLFLGTPEDNTADMFAKGRQQDREDRLGGALLTETQVSYIKLFLAEGWSQPELAKRYGVDHATISAINRGRTWSHVEPYQPSVGEPLPQFKAPIYRRF